MHRMGAHKIEQQVLFKSCLSRVLILNLNNISLKRQFVGLLEVIRHDLMP